MDFIKNRTVIAGIAALVTMALLMLIMVQLTRKAGEYAQVKSVESYLDVAREAHALHQIQMLSLAQDLGIRSLADDDAARLTATQSSQFFDQLMMRLSDRHHDKTFRFFYPTAWATRPQFAPQNAFERDAVQAFALDPGLSHFIGSDRETGNDQMLLAMPLRFEPACPLCVPGQTLGLQGSPEPGDLIAVLSIGQKKTLPQIALRSNMSVWLIGLWLMLLATFVSLFRVITKLTSQNQELGNAKRNIETLASKDPVCGIANRRQYLLELTELLAGQNKKLAVLTLDLRGFKSVNDIHGHSSGDDLLRAVSQRLLVLCPQNGLVARLGGDEFALIVQDHLSPQELDAFAHALVESISKPYVIDGRVLRVSSTAGIAVAPAHGQTAEDLLASADLAMYEARLRGAAPVLMFDAAMRADAWEANARAAELRRAMEKGHIETFYQPQYCLQNGELVGLEALVRWNHPLAGYISPAEFLPTAHQFGFVTDLSKCIVECIIKDMENWASQGFEVPHVSINLHPDQLRDPGHMDWVVERLMQSSIPTSTIMLEITEECVLGRGGHAAAEALEQLRLKGFRISLDDFGTGYASLSHIKELPVDELKIDRSFVHNIDVDEANRTIVAGLIAVAATLNIDVVAEGIETTEQAAVLTKLKCPKVQGYLFGRGETGDVVKHRFAMANSQTAKPKSGGAEIPGPELVSA